MIGSLFGKGKVQTPYTRETGPGDFISQYMFGQGATGPRTMGVTDPTLQGRILGAEGLYRPQYTGLELSNLATQLYGLEAGRVNPEIEMVKAEIAKYRELAAESRAKMGQTKRKVKRKHFNDEQQALAKLREAEKKLASLPQTIDTATPGMFELSRAAAEEAGITQRSEEDLQRAADVGALEQYAPQVVEAYREADPYSTGLAESQTAMAQDLYQRAQGLNPEQQRLADQQALQMSQRVGRIGDESSVASQILGREQYLSGLRGEAAGMGQQAFGMNKLMAGDSGMAILGRPTQSAVGGSALMGSTQGLRTGPALFDPNAGINYGMQNQANMMGLQGAQAQAAASRSAGISGMIGQIAPAVLGSASKYATGKLAASAAATAAGGAAKAGIGATLGKVGLTALSMFCWVAREVYGTETDEWMQFREWMLNDAPSWFRKLYIKHGERFAKFISNKPRIKSVIRKWMDTKIK